MKNLLLLLALFLTGGLTAQTVYVNAANATPGDGSSWATAYTDLNAAILDAPSGASVWVAAGTYVTPDSASFYINKELDLLGGFAGTETNADAADPDANVTILSGDVMGNDSETYDSLAYSDNNRVLLVEDTAVESQFIVNIDGLTITHGAVAADRTEGALEPFSGGGLLALGRVDVSRTKFSFNRANFGAAIYIRTSVTSGSVFDGLEFTNNFTSFNRTFYIRDNVDILIANSTFRGFGLDEQMTNGFIRGFRMDELTIENCTFEDFSVRARGGAVAVQDCDDVIVRGCTFQNGMGQFGAAGIYNIFADTYTTERTRDLDDFIVEDCTFKNISGDGAETDDIRGAGVYAIRGNMTVRNSSFEDMITKTNGAAIYFETDGEQTEPYLAVLDNLTVDNAEGAGNGGAISFLHFDETTATVELTNSTFKECINTADRFNNGAAFYQFAANSLAGNGRVDNCTFEDSWSETGTIGLAADHPFTITNSTFDNLGDPNRTFRGASITAYLENPDAPVTIDNCTFTNNIITDKPGQLSAGAVLYLFGATTGSIPLNITNSTFDGNSATSGTSGGALFTIRGWDMTVDNCDFTNNQAAGEGGAIYMERRLIVDTTGGGRQIFTRPFTGRVLNSRLNNNLATRQGGAISTQRAAVDLVNNTFINNAIGADGASGGAVIFNGNAPFFDASGELLTVGNFVLTSEIYHNTFVNNFHGAADGAVGDHIALFQPGTPAGVQIDTNSLNVTMANNVFINVDPTSEAIAFEPGEETPGFIVPFGDLGVTSLGGNFFNQEIDPAITLLDADVSNTDLTEVDEVSALFLDIYNDEDNGFNADLIIPDNIADNPLINAGVTGDFVPEMDIRGNPRGDAPDIGAFETEFELVSTDQPLANSGLKVSFYPNPTVDYLTVQNEESSISTIQATVVDQQGRALKAYQLNGASNQLDLTALPAGIYNLRLLINGQVYGQQIVKQ